MSGGSSSSSLSSPIVGAIRARLLNSRGRAFGIQTFITRPSSSPTAVAAAAAAAAASRRLSGVGNKMSPPLSAPSSSTVTPPKPRPSSSVLLISPTNEILLLHRVKSSSSFPSAHVFPGGNLDAFHDGEVPAVGTPGRHRDGLAYRLGAIRETFEETGILLAKRRKTDGGSGTGGELVDLPQSERDEARKRIHGSKVRFTDWLASIDAEADIDGLVPFTRWITPVTNPRRFTTQMYLYFLPISRSSTPQAFSEMLVPTSDGGLEHTAADFAPPSQFLSRADADEITLFPPQYYLLHHLSRFLTPAKDERPSIEIEAEAARLAAQRRKLLSFLSRVPTAVTPEGRAHATSWIPWGEKCIGALAVPIFKGDTRLVFSLDDPGPELEGSDRGGDWESVVIGKSRKTGFHGLQVCSRQDVARVKEAMKKGEDSKL